MIISAVEFHDLQRVFSVISHVGKRLRGIRKKEKILIREEKMTPGHNLEGLSHVGVERLSYGDDFPL